MTTLLANFNRKTASWSLPDRRASGFFTAEVEEFAAMFRSLQRESDEMVPPRLALSPRVSRGLTRFIALCELKLPDALIVRLVGTAVSGRMKISQAGNNYLDFIPQEQREQRLAECRLLLGHPCGGHSVVLEQYDSGPAAIEVASFPLTDKSGAAIFIVSISVELDRQRFVLPQGTATETGRMVWGRYIDIGGGVPVAGVWDLSGPTPVPIEE